MVKNLSINNSVYEINKKDIHSFISRIRKELDIQFDSLLINFITADELLDINKKYLKHDYYTDIITFNYSGNHKLIDGEIFISFDAVIQNSKKFKVGIHDEAGRLLIHGLLHLIGLNDKSRIEKRIMRKKENELLNKFKFLLLQANEKF